MTAENIVIKQESVPSVTEKVKNKESGDTESIKVEGLALPFDTQSRNGVVYTKKSIKETKDQMIGCSVLWNHDDSIPSLGKVVDTEIKENQEGYRDGLYYMMELDTVGELESKVARKLEKGYISNVSIQAAVDDEGLEAPRVDVKDWYELTICNIAGFPQTTTDTSEQSVDGVPEKVKLNGRVSTTEMALAEKLNENMEQQWSVESPEFEEAVMTAWDGVDKEEFESQSQWESVHVVRHGDEYHLPVAHLEDGELKLVLEAIRSAYRMVSRIESVPADVIEDARSLLEDLRETEYPDEEELAADQENVNGDDDTMEFENFDDLDEDIAEKAENLYNENEDLTKDEAILKALRGSAENSNKNGGGNSKDMSGDDTGNDDSQEQNGSDVEEMVEQMQETVNELGDRIESIEEQVANMQEKSDDDEDDMDDDEDESGTSKQGFDPDNAQDASESTRNRIAESLRDN